MDDPIPKDTDALLAELDRIKGGLSQVLEALSPEEMEVFMLEAEALLASVEFESATAAANPEEGRPPWTRLHNDEPPPESKGE